LLSIFLAWKMDFGFILNWISADEWGPPVIVSVGPRRVLIGHRGRCPPAARAGIKLPGRQLLSEASVAVPKLSRLASAPVSSAMPPAAANPSAATCRYSFTLSRSQAPGHFFPSVAGAVAPEAPPPSSSPVSGPPSSPQHFAATFAGHPHSVLPSSAGCHAATHLHLRQSASAMPTPSPPLPRLEHKPKVTHQRFKVASASRSRPR
jgi:hypothetical protein